MEEPSCLDIRHSTMYNLLLTGGYTSFIEIYWFPRLLQQNSSTDETDQQEPFALVEQNDLSIYVLLFTGI